MLAHLKMTGETPEVRSDKRKPKMAAMVEIAASICIQISKRKTMYIGRNAQNQKVAADIQ